MAGRIMTHSLAFVSFLPSSEVRTKLLEIADEEQMIVEEIESLNAKVRAVREKASDLLLDVTPRHMAVAKQKVKEMREQQEKAEKEAQASTAQ